MQNILVASISPRHVQLLSILRFFSPVNLEISHVLILIVKWNPIRKYQWTTLEATTEGVDSYNKNKNKDDNDNKNWNHLMFIEHLLCAGHCTSSLYQLIGEQQAH